MSDEDKDEQTSKSRLSSNFGKLSEAAKETAKQGLQKVGDKALETAKAGAAVVEEKTKEFTEIGKKKLEEKAQEVITGSLTFDENKNPNQESSGINSSRSNRGRNDKKWTDSNQKGRLSQFENSVNRSGRNLENQVITWYGWFWSTIAYMFIIMISFIIASTDGRFALLPIILLVGFPFFLYYAIVSSIPEIKVGNRVLFSRRDLSLRNQLTFTARVARTFSREMIQSSPIGAFLIYAFLLLLLLVLVLPFINA